MQGASGRPAASGDSKKRGRHGARRNKLLGLWAAELLGRSGPDADAYAKEVVIADLEEHGDEDVVRKLKADLEGKASEQQIRAQMVQLLEQAVAQVQKTG